MKTITITRKEEDGQFSLHAVSTSDGYVGDDVMNIAMNVIRRRGGDLILDEGTWDDYVWG